jgi:hypothetical protein
MHIAQAGKAALRHRISRSISLGFLLTLLASLMAGCGGGAGDGSGSANVASVTPTTPPGPAPSPGTVSVSLSANPLTIATNGSSTLNWSSTNATACSASSGWSGTKAVSGSQNVGPLTANVTYTLSCSGAGGTNSSSVTITVTSGKVYTLEAAWAANPDKPDGYTVYLGATAGSATNLVKTLVKGGTDWNPLTPTVQIPSTSIQSVVGAGSQACVQIKAYNAAGLSPSSQATCITLP